MDNNDNIDSNHHQSITYIPINKYIYNDKKEDDSFDDKTISVLELSATEVTTNANNNVITIVSANGVNVNNEELPQYIQLNILLITLLLFIDTLCILRYIYLPVVLHAFFGPIWIIFPWTFAATINYFIQLLVLYSGENGRYCHYLYL